MTLDEAFATALEETSLERTAVRSGRQALLSGLTVREQEVAARVARGLSNRQIAEALVFSERTAEAHVAHCLAKLGLASRSQLAAWAVMHGLIESSQPTVRT